MKRRSVFTAILFVALAAAGTIFLPPVAAAQNLDQQANQFNNQGRFAEAEALFKRSLANKEKSLGPNNPEVARSLNNLGAFYYAQGRYAEAEGLLKRGLAIREKVLGPNHSDVGNSLNNLAALYDEQGRYADAEPLYRRSITITEKAFGPNHSEVASGLNNLAVLYYKQGRYGDAEPLYRRSITVTEKSSGPNHSNVASALNNLGALYSEQGRYADAEPLYQRSLTIKEKAHGPNHPEVAPSLNNLASLYDDLGRYAEAEALYKRSLAIKEKSLGPNHTDVASSLNNLALVYYNQDRYADAEPLYKRSLAIKEKALGPNHPDVAPSLNNLALLYDDQKRYAEAEPLYKRALALKEKAFGPDHPDVANSLNNLARLYNNQQRYADALPVLKRMIVSRQARKGVFPIILGAEKAKFINKAQSFADSYDVLQFTSSSAAAEAVNRLAQRYAAGTGELATLVRRDQDLETESDKYDQAVLDAVSKPAKERNQAAEDELRKRLAAIKIERSKIQSNLDLKFPDYVALSNPQPISVQDTQKLLDGDEAVVAFDIGNENSYVWVVTKTASTWTEISTTTKTLDDQVKDLRQSITQSVDDSYDAALAHTIYQAIFGPIAATIADKKRLSIVANGALTSLPFGLLVTSQPSGKSLKDTDWLIKTHAITVIPSIYSLKTMRTQAGVSSAPKAMLAFADPVFSKSERTKAKSKQATLRSLPSLYQGTQIDTKALAERLPQLAGTRKEVETIGKTLNVDPADIKFGLAATETSVKQSNLDQYRILYFATHGLVSGDIAAFSKAKTEPALALAIPDKPNELDDGLLQASEVAQLKLNADWVVLSACNTASGDAVGAEALSGLARAFLYAGGRSLVVSHWEVDDEATAALMSNLFEISTKNPKLSHGQALQQAMLKQLDKAKTNAEAHPRMWAPFVVVGEPKRKI